MVIRRLLKRCLARAAQAGAWVLMLALSVHAASATAKTPSPAPGLVIYDMPHFPKELVGIKAGDGEVVLAITIDADGKVNDLVVLEATNEAFANSATQAVSAWTFAPVERRSIAEVSGAGALITSSDTWPRRQVLQFSFKRSGVVTTMSHAEAARDSFVHTTTPKLRTVLWSQLDSEPQRSAGVMPAISKAKLAKRGDQPLMISFVIDREGRVRVPVIAAVDDPALAQTVLETVQKWRYTPPLHKQEAVAVEVIWSLVLPRK